MKGDPMSGMIDRRSAGALVLAATLAVTLPAASPAAAEDSFPLLTEAELREKANDPFSRIEVRPDDARKITMTAADGPLIRVAAPAGFALTPPVDVDVTFEPRDGAAVDMGSLRIDYRLGLAWLNVTDRIRKKATIKGARLLARGADLPPGNHKLRFSIRDADNRSTRAVVTFSVAK